MMYWVKSLGVLSVSLVTGGAKCVFVGYDS